MKLKLYLFLLVFSCQFISFGQTLDQSNTTATALVESLFGGSTQNLSQSFTVGNTGQLSRISVNVDNVTNGPTLYVNCDLIIYNGEGFGGTVLGTYGFAVPDNVSGEFAINFAPIAVTSNQVVTFKIVANTTSSGRVTLLTTNDTYSGGVFYNGAPQAVPNRDLWFKTYVTSSAATHLNFDGVDDYVQVPAGINLANSSFTVEFMAKRTATNVNNYVLKQGNEVNNNLLHIGFRDNNDFTFAFWFNDINIPVSNYVADTNWHHWSCVYNNVNGTRQVYQDGVLVASDSGVSPYTGSGAIQIGSFNGNYYFYNGGIDDVRIWNIVRTAEQVNGSKNCELQGTETGLVAYYKFNQGFDAADNTSITTLTDATANVNNGTLVNFTKTGTTSNFLSGSPVTTGSVIPSAATVTTPVIYTQGATATALTATVGANGTSFVWYTTATGGTGVATAPTPSTATGGNTSYWVSSANANGCESARTEIVVTVNALATHLNFDGTDDSVSLPVNIGNTLSGGTEVTIEYWFKGTNVQSAVRIQNTSNWIVAGWNLAGNPQFLVSTDGGTNGVVIANSSSIQDNTWHHVACVWKKNEIFATYLDGVLQNSRVAANVNLPIFSANDGFIGALLGSSEFTNGNLDEVRIWNRALPLVEIQNNMNCELPTPSTQNGLVAYYQFNQGVNGLSNAGVTTLTDASANANNGTLSNFALTGTASNWLASSPIVTGSNCTVLSSSSFAVDSNVNLYPNPTNGTLNIDLNNLTNVSVSIYDINGRVILNKDLSGNENSVDLSNFQTGMYLFKIKSSEGEINKKVVKK